MPDETILWKALDETLQVFGDVFKNVIIADLNSMNRDNPTHGTVHLDMGMISDSLKRHFGLDAYEMIMNRVIAIYHDKESASITG